jgi:hypothetical protein
LCKNENEKFNAQEIEITVETPQRTHNVANENKGALHALQIKGPNNVELYIYCCYYEHEMIRIVQVK